VPHARRTQVALLDKLLREGVDDALHGGAGGHATAPFPADDARVPASSNATRISALDGRVSHDR